MNTNGNDSSPPPPNLVIHNTEIHSLSVDTKRITRHKIVLRYKVTLMDHPLRNSSKYLTVLPKILCIEICRQKYKTLP